MGIQMFQEHSECWKISSVSIWHSTQPGTARKCGLASSAQTEQKWVDGLGEDNPTDFLIRAVCISLCQRQAPCPLQTRQRFFLKLQVRQQAKGFFFQDAEGETAWVLGEVRFHSILPPSSVLSRKQVMCPIPTSFKKTVEGTMQTRPLDGRFTESFFQNAPSWFVPNIHLEVFVQNLAPRHCTCQVAAVARLTPSCSRPGELRNTTPRSCNRSSGTSCLGDRMLRLPIQFCQ